jgi:uncharacterized integral membrane protein (TIGR00698 family)
MTLRPPHIATKAKQFVDSDARHAYRFEAALSLRAMGAIRSVVPGLSLTAGIAAAALLVARTPGFSAFSPMIIAMVMGIAIRNTVGVKSWARPGIGFSVKRLLRIAIVLLGLQLTIVQVVAVGGRGMLIVAATLLASFIVTVRIGRWLGVNRQLAELIAAGTSICGASAVIATNTVTQAPDEDVSYAVACVTIFGSLAMLIYPWLSTPLGLEPHAYGLWAGASIHEVAQVVAAGFQNGQAAGEFATIAKLARVMLLAPMVLFLGLLAQRAAARRRDDAALAARPPMPWFVLGFVAMVGLGSMIGLPVEWKRGLATLTSFLLSTALAGMGFDTDLRKLTAEGIRPALLGAFASLFIASFSVALIKLTG